MRDKFATIIKDLIFIALIKKYLKTTTTLNRIVLVYYKPAELHKGKEWRLEFYAKILAQNEFKRFRKRVLLISPVKEREKYAKKWSWLSIRS